MATALRDECMTPADQLRVLLSESEEIAVRLRGDGAVALRFLENMDRIADLWPLLEAAGVDLRAESGRWETLQLTASRRGRELVRSVAPLGGLAKLRQERHGSNPAGEWWFLQERLTAERRRAVRRTGLILVAVLLVGVAASAVLRLVFPVDPAVRASMAKLMSGQQKIDNLADYGAAAADFRAATEANPSSAEAWLWLGGVLQVTGAEGAQECFDKARGLSGGEVEFRLARSQVYIRLSVWKEAQADLEAALAIDPGSPEAYYFLASVYEMQGQFSEAMSALDKAGELADQRGLMEMVAMSRYRQGMMMQGLQAQPFTGSTATTVP